MFAKKGGSTSPSKKKSDLFCLQNVKIFNMPWIFFLLKPFFSDVIFLVTLFNIVHFRAFRFDKKGEKSLLFLSAKGADGGGVRAKRKSMLRSRFFLLFTPSLKSLKSNIFIWKTQKRTQKQKHQPMMILSIRTNMYIILTQTLKCCF